MLRLRQETQLAASQWLSLTIYHTSATLYDVLLLGFTPLFPIHETLSDAETLHHQCTTGSRTNRSAMPYHPSRLVTLPFRYMEMSSSLELG